MKTRIGICFYRNKQLWLSAKDNWLSRKPELGIKAFRNHAAAAQPGLEPYLDRSVQYHQQTVDEHLLRNWLIEQVAENVIASNIDEKQWLREELLRRFVAFKSLLDLQFRVAELEDLIGKGYHYLQDRNHLICQKKSSLAISVQQMNGNTVPFQRHTCQNQLTRAYQNPGTILTFSALLVRRRPLPAEA